MISIVKSGREISRSRAGRNRILHDISDPGRSRGAAARSGFSPQIRIRRHLPTPASAVEGAPAPAPRLHGRQADFRFFAPAGPEADWRPFTTMARRVPPAGPNRRSPLWCPCSRRFPARCGPRGPPPDAAGPRDQVRPHGAGKSLRRPMVPDATGDGNRSPKHLQVSRGRIFNAGVRREYRDGPPGRLLAETRTEVEVSGMLPERRFVPAGNGRARFAKRHLLNKLRISGTGHFHEPDPVCGGHQQRQVHWEPHLLVEGHVGIPPCASIRSAPLGDRAARPRPVPRRSGEPRSPVTGPASATKFRPSNAPTSAGPSAPHRTHRVREGFPSTGSPRDPGIRVHPRPKRCRCGSRTSGPVVKN